MIIERLPGLENEQDLQQTLKSLDDSIYPERRLGRNKQADLFEETITALLEIRFEEENS